MTLKETFSKRKIGKQLVSVAMLGLAVSQVALSSAHVVLADEANAQSEAATNSSKQLADLITKAKSLGINVKTEAKKTFQSQAELDAFNQKQIAELNKAISDAGKTSSDNQALTQKYEADLKKYQADKAEYDKQKKEYDAAKAKYDADLANFNAQKAEYDKKKAELEKSRIANDDAANLVVTGAFNTGAKGADFYRNVQVTYIGSDKTVTGVNDIGWNAATTVTDAFGGLRIEPYNPATSNTNGKVPSGQEKPLYRISGTNVGAGFKIKNIGKTTDGRNLNAKVTITNNTTDDKSVEQYFILGYGASNGSYKPIAIDYANWKQPGFKFSYEDDNGNPIKVVQGTIVGDVDYVQGSKITYNGNTLNFINPPGSELTVHNLYGLLAGNWGVDGIANAPKGTYLGIGVGSEMTYTHTTSLDDNGNPQSNGKDAPYIEFMLFGTGSSVKIDRLIQPTQPKAPEAPKAPVEPKKPDTVKSDLTVTVSEASLVITKHIDITTSKELHPQEEGTKPKRTFDGYEFVETKTQDGNTIHYYKPIDKTPIKPKEDKPVKKVHTRHYDITTGKELTKEEEGTQPKRTFDGYEFVETKTKDGDTEHYYKPVQKPVKKVITKYIDKDTGKELIPQEDGTQPKKDIPGYRFVETKDEDGNTIHYYQRVHTRHYDITTGKELAPQEDGTQPKREFNGYEFVETKDKDGDTEHFYRPIKKVTTVWITKDGKVLKEKTEGTLPKEDFDGYEFVETKTDEDGNTTHIYKPIAKVITKHIDITTGKELAPQEDGKQPKKEIEGYEFVETKNEDGNTIHYYKPITKVITKHIDIDTNEEIAPQEDGKQPKKDIEGYEFVETKDDKGNTLHYYRKVKKPVEIKGKTPTPTKYADTNEVASAIPTILGILGLSGLGSIGFMKRRKR